MRPEQLNALASEYAADLAAREELDTSMKKCKELIIQELEKDGGLKFEFGEIRAAKRTIKGGVNMKSIQEKYDISDMELDDFRKDSKETWYLTRKKS